MEFRVRRRCWLSVISTASFFRMRLHGRRVRFKALQPPRVRYPIWWQGELLPPDQMAGGRARTRMRLVIQRPDSLTGRDDQTQGLGARAQTDDQLAFVADYPPRQIH